MEWDRKINDVVETLRNAKGRNRCCSLLVGAGCSVTAGVPAAGGFVKIIKERYPQAYERATAKTYPSCMSQLMIAERRDLIAEQVDLAKINWAHIGIALLMQAGFVDRVLTTNFDLLAMRSCSLIGEFPAVYDFGVSQLFKRADIPGRAIFHLHGQRTGFVLIHTEEDFKKHSTSLGPVFEDAGTGRVWIVVGYSGDNDPVFEHLANVPMFDNGLYWVGYGKDEPAEHVRTRLLNAGKDAFYLRGLDADSFFVTLTQKLGLFPPPFVARPFTHLEKLLSGLAAFNIPGTESEKDVTEGAKERIRLAIKNYEESPLPTPGLEAAGEADGRAEDIPPEAAALKSLMAGDYDGVLRFEKSYVENPSAALADSLFWAYVMQGDTLQEKANTQVGEEADRLFVAAGEKYAAAFKINPDKHNALNNWAVALIKQAKTKSGEEADRLFTAAYEKCAAALKIKPDKHEALHIWAAALSEQAKTKSGEEADRLFAAAGEKYAAALQIKPDKHEALNNWGATLVIQAKTKSGEEADRLFNQALALLKKSEGIKPGGAAYNTACLESVRGKPAVAMEWLEKSFRHGTLPKKEEVLADPDLKELRETEEFRDFVRRAYSEELPKKPA